MSPRQRLEAARLYGILDLGYVAEDDLEERTGQLLAGGVDLLQLRAKGHPPERILAMARRAQPLCAAEEVPFIINDYPELAAEVGADGVHLGQEDGALAEVRSRLGDEILLGRSTHSPAQAQAALQEGADYIGFGPLFPTPTKEGRPGIGLSGIAAVEAEVGARIPVFCIGGIKPDNLPAVVGAGARRVVVVSALLQASDVTGMVARIRKSLPPVR